MLANYNGFDSFIRSVFTKNVQIGSSSLSDKDLLFALALGIDYLDAKTCVVFKYAHMKDARKAYHYFCDLVSKSADAVKVLLYPYINFWGASRFENPTENFHKKVGVINSLYGRQKVFIFTTDLSLRMYTSSPELFAQNRFTVEVGNELDAESFTTRLVQMGFRRRSTVEEAGYFSWRGGMIDIFLPGDQKPARIELLGDVVSSIRSFSPETQKSVLALKHLNLSMVDEFILDDESLPKCAQDLYDYFLEHSVDRHDRQAVLEAFHRREKFAGYHKLAPVFSRSSHLLVDHIRASERRITTVKCSTDAEFESVALEFKDRITAEYLAEKQQAKVTVDPSFHYDFEKAQSLYSQSFIDISLDVDTPDFTLQKAIFNSIKSKNFEKLSSLKRDDRIETLENFLSLSEQKIVFLESRDRLQKMSALLEYKSITYEVVDVASSLSRLKQSDVPSVVLTEGKLDGNVSLVVGPDAEIICVPGSFFFGSSQDSHEPDRKLKNYLNSFKELRPGDLVVHVQHGVGRFLSLQTMEIGNQRSDFLLLEYGGDDKVYLPVDRVSLLQKYSAGDSNRKVVPLDRLKGSSWQKRKNKVSEAVEIMAEELLTIHAKRAVAKSSPFGKIPLEFEKFEHEFPYEETPDQLSVLLDVERDVTSGKIMDRLIVGDVGFGKTEIAIRASFRAVLEGRQVMVLAPTTVLCFQHFETFKERLEPFGVSVAAVNRFVKASEVKTVKEGFNGGTVDVVIGTHKLLHKDFKPKRLGLLVVDEEQRFGVGHKERIKELKASAHILTLTATPIPRTLHMSMLGLRDISLLTTPPSNRVSIKNFLIRFDEKVISEAVQHEVRRGGQVFIVHNRVEDIVEIANFVSQACGGLDVKVGHGQMQETELESVIVDFLKGTFPVLVCTTIIESGIDMPRVNTILINNAHHFGLSQLYQLRGRVGRSAVQGYAYFISPPVDRLTEEARKRLQVLMAYQDLGSGFHIASHDLEIRGAGNLLGEKQSGHIATVGIELYTKMLEAAIQKVRGEIVTEEIEPEIKILKPARIPEDYIFEQTERLSVYKKLFAAVETTDVERYSEEIVDRYGAVPEGLETLFFVAKIKILLRKLKVVLMNQRGPQTFELKFHALSEHLVMRLRDASVKFPAEYRLFPDYKMYVYVDSDMTSVRFEQLYKSLEKLLG